MNLRDTGIAELLIEIARRACPKKNDYSKDAYQIAYLVRAYQEHGLRFNPEEDIYTIEGINYKGEFLRGVGGAFPLGMLIEIVDRDGKGSVHFRVLYNPKGETK